MNVAFTKEGSAETASEALLPDTPLAPHNGDGRTDILWRNDNGAVSTWDMNDHTFTGFDFTASAGVVPIDWKVAGTGDFNGDGKTDILWRRDNGQVATWDMNDHTFVGFNFTSVAGTVPTSWHKHDLFGCDAAGTSDRCGGRTRRRHSGEPCRQSRGHQRRSSLQGPRVPRRRRRDEAPRS